MRYRKKRFVSVGDAIRMEKRREERVRTILVDPYDFMAGCWLSPFKYMNFNGAFIHQIYAAGEGSLVRHLCCNNYCVNPMHLIRGENWENSQDEVEMFKVFGYCLENKMDLIHKYKDQHALYASFIKEGTKIAMAKQPIDRIVRDQIIYAEILISAFDRSNTIRMEVRHG